MSSFREAPELEPQELLPYKHAMAVGSAPTLTSKFPIERVVTVLTPLFAAVSAFVVAWVGKHFPGLPKIGAGDVTALMITGATAAFGIAWKWLHGRQKFLADVEDAHHIIYEAVEDGISHQKVVPGLTVDEVGTMLKAHTATIVDAMEHAVHAPPSVEEVIAAMMQKMDVGPRAAPPASGAAGTPAQFPAQS
jgi:hypothetical protein